MPKMDSKLNDELLAYLHNLYPDRELKFDENPVSLQIFGSFIRFALENRFAMSDDQSVLWGVYLSSLAHKAGDKNYEKLAYGDVKDQVFKLNI